MQVFVVPRSWHEQVLARDDEVYLPQRCHSRRRVYAVQVPVAEGRMMGVVRQAVRSDAVAFVVAAAARVSALGCGFADHWKMYSQAARSE